MPLSKAKMQAGLKAITKSLQAQEYPPYVGANLFGEGPIVDGTVDFEKMLEAIAKAWGVEDASQ